jgi:hypothetical protein
MLLLISVGLVISLGLAVLTIVDCAIGRRIRREETWHPSKGVRDGR